MTQAEWSQTLYASRTGIVLMVLGGALLLVLSLVIVVINGVGVFTGLLCAVAVVSALVVAWDMPTATTITPEGLHRQTPLRRHHIPWSRVTRIDRIRAGLVRTRSGNQAGGLVARVGWRRVALTDRMESAVEFDLLRDGLGHDRADALGFVAAIRPADGRTPTWQSKSPRHQAR